MTTAYNYPVKKGNIDIFPEIHEGNLVTVSIIGDPEGLKYLSEILSYLAGFDQNGNDAPVGSREHTHLHAEYQLGTHSCEVEICRADAKGTGELPEFMKKT